MKKIMSADSDDDVTTARPPAALMGQPPWLRRWRCHGSVCLSSRHSSPVFGHVGSRSQPLLTPLRLSSGTFPRFCPGRRWCAVKL